MTNGIRLAAEESARLSNFPPRFQVGCVCFKGKRILSCGFNQIRSFSRIPNRYKIFEYSLHAEQHAIGLVRNKEVLRGASILVVRINRHGDLRLARPCPMCMNTIRFFGLKEILYSDSFGNIILEKL